MPVKQIQLGAIRENDNKAQELRRRLADEWSGKNDTPEPRPDIREEVDRSGHIVHLYVIWNEWGNLDQQRRSELIMDAFVEVRGMEAALDISVTMGLTTEEARRMGIE